jgi:hypothetical protein
LRGIGERRKRKSCGLLVVGCGLLVEEEELRVAGFGLRVESNLPTF